LAVCRPARGGARPLPAPLLLLPVLLGRAQPRRASWPAVPPAAPGWSGRWACPRARTLPGSLLAAISGSCPHPRRADCHDSRWPGGRRTVCAAWARPRRFCI